MSVNCANGDNILLTALNEGSDINIKADEPGVLSGAVFRAGEAINLGMANAVLDIEGSVENVFARATYK